jgi:hypothetical protein
MINLKIGFFSRVMNSTTYSLFCRSLKRIDRKMYFRILRKNVWMIMSLSYRKWKLSSLSGSFCSMMITYLKSSSL